MKEEIAAKEPLFRSRWSRSLVILAVLAAGAIPFLPTTNVWVYVAYTLAILSTVMICLVATLETVAGLPEGRKFKVQKIVETARNCLGCTLVIGPPVILIALWIIMGVTRMEFGDVTMRLLKGLTAGSLGVLMLSRQYKPEAQFARDIRANNQTLYLFTAIVVVISLLWSAVYWHEKYDLSRYLFVAGAIALPLLARLIWPGRTYFRL